MSTNYSMDDLFAAQDLFFERIVQLSDGNNLLGLEAYSKALVELEDAFKFGREDLNIIQYNIGSKYCSELVELGIIDQNSPYYQTFYKNKK